MIKNKQNNKYFNMINEVDSQLYEISKIIKEFDSSIITHDLLNDVIDMIEKNVSFQYTNKDLLKVIKVEKYTN